MRQFFLAFCVFLILITGTKGQPPPKPPPAENREATTLAATFYNRYQQTNDITPLISEYFVLDFARRLEFCITTRECEGFGRDFWKDGEERPAFKATPKDFLRQYTGQIDYFFLYMQSVRYLALWENQKPSDFEEKAQKTIITKLKAILKGQPEILELDWFENPDLAYVRAKSIDQLRQQLSDFEKLIAALRIVGIGIRRDLRKTHPKIDLSLRANTFRALVDVNSGRFFDYPAGTRMIQVWANDMEVPFIMEMIRERGKLKIVAIYPPID